MAFQQNQEGFDQEAGVLQGGHGNLPLELLNNDIDNNNEAERTVYLTFSDRDVGQVNGAVLVNAFRRMFGAHMIEALQLPGGANPRYGWLILTDQQYMNRVVGPHPPMRLKIAGRSVWLKPHRVPSPGRQ